MHKNYTNGSLWLKSRSYYAAPVEFRYKSEPAAAIPNSKSLPTGKSKSTNKVFNPVETIIVVSSITKLLLSLNSKVMLFTEPAYTSKETIVDGE